MEATQRQQIKNTTDLAPWYTREQGELYSLAYE